jgi:histidine triad (HIT) family protein
VHTSDPDCPFCEIVHRDDPDAREIYRDESVVAFFPTEPATLGHTLLIPRNHVPQIWDLEDDVAGRMATATLAIASAIRRAVVPQGMNIIQSNGKAASQSVFHLHVHIVPRWEGDAIGEIWPPQSNYSGVAKDRAWADIRTECETINK